MLFQATQVRQGHFACYIRTLKYKALQQCELPMCSSTGPGLWPARGLYLGRCSPLPHFCDEVEGLAMPALVSEAQTLNP